MARGHWLVTGLETGEELELHLLDVSKDELAADIGATSGEPSRSGLHRLLVERGPRTAGGEPFALIVGDYRFGDGVEDLALLSALGANPHLEGEFGAFLASAEKRLVAFGDGDAP